MRAVKSYTLLSNKAGKGLVVFLTLLVGLLGTSAVGARSLNRPADHPGRGSIQPLFKPVQGDTVARPARVTWIGVGDLAKFPVTNCALLGLYEEPADWEGYDGTWPENVTNWNGFCAEFPPGTMQFYNFSSGIWVGAPYPVIIGTDTTWVPRVLTGAYDPDNTPMSDLCTSDQRIPEGRTGAGNYKYVQPGKEPESYQELWPYADTTLNLRRPTDQPLEEGDFVSLLDTWAVMGDWIPEEEGYFLYPSYGYDTEPLGIRLEQRTYSWNYAYNSRYVYVDYKIRNMNSFALDNVYVGYFMDNDIGHGELTAAGMGPNDDLIGFNIRLNLGYTYDFNFEEPDWKTPAGYIGSVFCETPLAPLNDGRDNDQDGLIDEGTDGIDNDGDGEIDEWDEQEQIGITGFQTWTREGPEGNVDQSGQDERKYAELVGVDVPDDPDPAQFETFLVPRDVRQLMASGPFRLEASGESGDEVTVTFAIVVGEVLEELEVNTQFAISQYVAGYVGPEPPPPPDLTVTPGDGRVYLSWNSFPEDFEDPVSHKKDFEGYRVYRNPTGLPADWELLAEYDLSGTQTPDTVLVRYSGESSAAYTFAGFYDFWKSVKFVGGIIYSIAFTAESEFTVYNKSADEVYLYNRKARDPEEEPVEAGGGWGYCVVNPADDTAYPDAGYRSGALIYFDGIYIRITDDPSGGINPDPDLGDVYIVEMFSSSDLGDQTGSRYSYTDDDVTNGMLYYYFVTSYDRGSPIDNLPPLECGKTLAHSVIPRTIAADKYGGLAAVTHSQGPGTGTVEAAVAQPAEVTGDDYEMTFIAADTLTTTAGYWRLVNVTADSVVLDSMVTLLGESNPEVLDGMVITVDGPEEVSIDTIWWSEGDCSYEFVSTAKTIEPYDYEVTFPDTGSTDVNGVRVPWLVWNTTLNSPSKTCLFPPIDTIWTHNDFLLILIEGYEPPFNPRADVAIQLLTNMSDSTNPPDAGDVFSIQTHKPFTTEDRYRISTKGLTQGKDSYTLDNIKVVPNPYYIRAAWDTDRFNQWVNFTHLPSECTIRIFTVSGLLIRTIEHESATASGTERWDLLTEEGMMCVSGLYVYQVEAGDGKTKVGKFAIIR